MTDTCTDGACYNLGDDVNCIHNPDHAEIARPKQNLTAQGLLDELKKLGERIDLSTLHIGHDVSFIDFFGDNSTSQSYVHEQIIVNYD